VQWRGDEVKRGEGRNKKRKGWRVRGTQGRSEGGEEGRERGDEPAQYAAGK